MLLAGVNKGKSHLYTSDVTGNFFAYRANAIGENDEPIKEQLRGEFNDDMTMDEGIKFALNIFKKVLGKNFEIERFEATYIKQNDPKLVRLHGDSLKKYVR
jgi:20S proteasome alpha/beta subunit